MATKRISGDYSDKDILKDDLQAEVDARKLEVKGTGANGIVTKDDLIAALEADDKARAAGGLSGGPSGPGKPFAETAPGNIPRVQGSTSLGGAEPTPAAEDFTKGTFKRKSDGEEYALTVVKMNPLNGRTHRAMNTLHYWEGTEEQFTKAFTEKNGAAIAIGKYPPKDAPKDE